MPPPPEVYGQQPDSCLALIAALGLILVAAMMAEKIFR